MQGATDQHTDLKGDDTAAFRYLAGVCGAVAGDAAVVPATADAPTLAAIPALARRHRIATRAADALARALRPTDPAAADRLAAYARTRRFAALHRTERLAAISAALSAAGIRHFGIKGPVLARQLYGDVAARDSKDIDLLIDPATLAASVSVLAAMGFDDVSIHGEAGERFANKHLTFAGHGVEVELHTRLLDVDALLDLSFEALWPRRETVMLGGTAVPALSRVDTLLYLCAHGGQHLWFRLKWLEDIARIVTLDARDAQPSVVADAVRAARATRAEAIVLGAVQLVEQVFGIAGPSPVPATRASRRIARLSHAALVAPADHAAAPPLGWIVRKLWMQLGIGRWRYRGDMLRLALLAPRDFDAPALPPALRWLRLPLRPVMLLRDRWSRG